MQLSNNQQAFFALIRAGLFPGLWLRSQRSASFAKAKKHGEWGTANDSLFKDVDWDAVLQIATDQSVVGLATAGIEPLQGWLRDNGLPLIPKTTVLQFIGQTQYIEQQNKDMNAFVAKLIGKLREAGIEAVLVKGQGVAQCYERPLWRTSGDIDLLLDYTNYEKAKIELFPIADEIQPEDVKARHQAMMIMGIDVELHGTMPFALSKKAELVNEAVVRDSLLMAGEDSGSGICVWKNGDTDVYLPNPDNHVFLVFTHFLHHFFIEGVGLRQICDWCRMLYTYRGALNVELLEQRVRQAGLMSEWKAFASLAADTLGMPSEAMPFYDERYKRKGSRVLQLVLTAGNFGHNKDLSYRTRYSGMTYKIVAAWRRLKDFASLMPVFPLDAPKFFFTYLLYKAK